MAKKKCSNADNPFLKDDWTTESLDQTWLLVKDLADNKYGITYYSPHFEVVTFEDMLQIYTGSLPITYDHWSFGKAYTELHKRYTNNRMGIAYEVIFNTSPALCYLTEHNSPAMQGLVMAHAAIGHSAFFRNNCIFKEMTNAAIIIPFLKNMKQFVKECETEHGSEAVEKVLDVCHALSYYAIDRRPVKETTHKQRNQRKLDRAVNKDKDYDTRIESIKHIKNDIKNKAIGATRLREENILKFIGKYSPSLKQWQRELISMYCKVQQYLYPQMMTKLMNEGFASFWHHTIMSDLSDQGLLDAGSTIEFLHSHCSVLRQPEFDERGYYGINPYKLGFEIFKDIRRICSEPTEEDREWFPGLVDTDWVEQVKFAAYNFKDDSFLLQYLSPKLIRDFKLFLVTDDDEEDKLNISQIHDDEGYKEIRRKLSEAYSFGNRIPDIYVEGWDARKSRTLYLTIQGRNRVPVGESGDAVITLIKTLWPFPIKIKALHEDGSLDAEGTL
jgi:stage V sporulation protein R